MIAPHGLNGHNGVTVVPLVAEVLVRESENVSFQMVLLCRPKNVLALPQKVNHAMKINAQVTS